MKDREVEAWRMAAEDLGLEIVAPCELNLGLPNDLNATALIKNFGAKNGMIVDPAWSVLEPFCAALLDAGYGYSAVQLGGYERALMIAVLEDWGWTGSHRTKPEWLK